MAEADESTEQCATCRKHVHTQCMKEWIKQKKDRGDELLCVLCRSAWKDEEGAPAFRFLSNSALRVELPNARHVDCCAATTFRSHLARYCALHTPQIWVLLAQCRWHGGCARARVHSARACAGTQLTAGGYLNLAGQHGHAPNLGELYGDTAQWLSCDFAGFGGRGRRGGRHGGGGGGRRRGRGRY